MIRLEITDIISIKHSTTAKQPAWRCNRRRNPSICGSVILIGIQVSQLPRCRLCLRLTGNITPLLATAAACFQQWLSRLTGLKRAWYCRPTAVQKWRSTEAGEHIYLIRAITRLILWKLETLWRLLVIKEVELKKITISALGSASSTSNNLINPSKIIWRTMTRLKFKNRWRFLESFADNSYATKKTICRRLRGWAESHLWFQAASNQPAVTIQLEGNCSILKLIRIFSRNRPLLLKTSSILKIRPLIVLLIGAGIFLVRSRRHARPKPGG